jgi:hypothetical protein
MRKIGLYGIVTTRKIIIGITRGISCGNIAKSTSWYHK